MQKLSGYHALRNLAGDGAGAVDVVGSKSGRAGGGIGRRWYGLLWQIASTTKNRGK
jgi:hypothetical protein